MPIGIAVVEMLLVCHVIKQDHMIKGSGDFNDRIPLRYVTTLASFVVKDTVIGEI